MRKKHLYTVFFVLAGITLAQFITLSSYTRNRTKITPICSDTTVKVPKLLPINQVINNTDSDLPETVKFDKTIERFLTTWHINGASFALMKNDKLIYSKGYGYVDDKKTTPVDVMHIFRIASVSKLLTAVGIMKLVEEHKIQLSDCVFGANGILADSVYRNYSDKRYEKITIEELLRHQGGFTSAYGDPMFNPIDVAHRMGTVPPANLQTMIQFILSKRLRTSPGTNTRYSNIGYGILTKVIEKVSGEDYETFMKEQILYPAGCLDMHLGHNRNEERYFNEVNYYDYAGAEQVMACNGSGEFVFRCDGGNNIEGLQGAGGWVASPSELLRFLASINKSQEIQTILSEETIDMMTYDDQKSFPIGWMHTNNNGEWKRTGTLAGSSILLKRESNGYAWVFVTNTSTWKGASFTSTINYYISQAINNVKDWPDRNLFSAQSPDDQLLVVVK